MFFTQSSQFSGHSPCNLPGIAGHQLCYLALLFALLLCQASRLCGKRQKHRTKLWSLPQSTSSLYLRCEKGKQKNKKEKKTAGGDREGERKDETGLISVILSSLNTTAAIWHQLLHISDGWMGPAGNVPAHFTTWAIRSVSQLLKALWGCKDGLWLRLGKTYEEARVCVFQLYWYAKNKGKKYREALKSGLCDTIMKRSVCL